MTLLYEHKFAGGTAIRFIDRPFQAAQKEVLAVEIDGIVSAGRIGTIFAFLFDNDTKVDLAKELYIVLHQRYNPELKLVKDAICKTCSRTICDSCRKLVKAKNWQKSLEARGIKVEEALKKKMGRPRSKDRGKYTFTGKYSKKHLDNPAQPVNVGTEIKSETVQMGVNDGKV